MSFVILNEKLRATGLFPIKFVSRNPFHRLTYMKKRIKFNRTGIKAPRILTMLLIKSRFSLLLSRSKLINIKNGIKNKAVGFIIMLKPMIKLPTSCHFNS